MSRSLYFRLSRHHDIWRIFMNDEDHHEQG
jgi:hypothetical protein